MKTIQSRLRTAAVCFAGLICASPGVFAHTITDGLGIAASATDYYQVTCSNDGNGAPASLLVQIMGLSGAGAPLTSATVHKGLIASHTTDTTNGDAIASPAATLNGAAGLYNVFVAKTASSAVSYTLTFHCMTGVNGTGIHTGTTSTTKQNQ